MEQKIQRISIKGIFEKDGKILMLKDDKGRWELPGGKIDFGEHPTESLRREFMEELGVTELEIGKVVNVWDFLVSKDDIDYQFILVVYECFANIKDVYISDEHLKYEWISPQKIDNYEMKEGYRETINKFYNK